jgi:hypothetical protein
MNPIKPDLLRDFSAFGAVLIASEDVDPLYPILKWLEKDMEPEQALWFTFLYMAFYNVSSALQAFESMEYPQQLPYMFRNLPIATERRNLRAGVGILRGHVDDYVRRCEGAGGQQAFLQAGWGADPAANYETFWETAQTVYQNGRWAAFKWAEILKKVHGWNLEAPDMRMQFCSGPKAGLCDMFDLDEKAMEKAGESGIWALNFYGANLRQLAIQHGLVVPDWETLETVLCNFHSLRNGRYYVGHDIDELQETIDASDLGDYNKHWLYMARESVLPREYLGEFNGWHGVDKAANRLYRDTGLIYTRAGTLSHV